MADTKPPASERFSPCGHLGSGGAIADDDDDLGVPIFHLSKSLTDVATDPRDGEEASRCRPDLRKSASSAVCPQEAPETPWTPELAYRGVAGTPPLGSAPMSTAAANHLRPCKGRGLVPGGHLPQTASSSRDLRGERQDQALQRSHSVCLHAAREARSRGLGSCSEAGLTCSGTGCRFRRVPGCYSLGCRQAATALHADAMPPAWGQLLEPHGAAWGGMDLHPQPKQLPKGQPETYLQGGLRRKRSQRPGARASLPPYAVSRGRRKRWRGGAAPRHDAQLSPAHRLRQRHAAGLQTPCGGKVLRCGLPQRVRGTPLDRGGPDVQGSGDHDLPSGAERRWGPDGPPGIPLAPRVPKVSLAGEDGEAGVAGGGPGRGRPRR
ncbi:hypothetical protein ANANG_G00046780 [Anguilla anguilla]|uniref:Uncharacterized protein n=1 Tax=Anguilla anguilla TaxID=7936 RepID=A0A9D3MXN8_ANGAN|nr:hypothetical protein ANANG_G00046780 [Anguilla anguilla]